MQAMVLAAGLGTRLWPLTCDRGKPAVPFLGRPLVAGIVDLLHEHNIQRVVVNTHHQPESIRSALAGRTPEIRFSHEREILGTAGCLALARDEGLLSCKDETLIINAKLVTNVDLSSAIEAHKQSPHCVTMVLRSNPEREHFREVLVADGCVVGFGEGRIPKVAAHVAPLLFTGIHILDPEVLQRIPTGFSDTIRDVYPPFIASGQVAAHIDQKDRWWELSTLERYLDLHLQADSEGFIDPRAVVEPGAKVHRSVLWENTRVEAGARVERAVLGEGVQIRRGEQVEGAVVVRRALVDHIERGETWGDRVRVPLAPQLDLDSNERNHQPRSAPS